MLGAFNWGPLEQSAAGNQQRALMGQPAALHLHHASPQSQLRLRYRTLPGVDLQIRSATGQALTTLPPAPDGNEVVVELATFIADGELTVDVELIAGQAGGVWIEAISLPFPEAVGD
jgi:hypothetical protein